MRFHSFRNGSCTHGTSQRQEYHDRNSPADGFRVLSLLLCNSSSHGELRSSRKAGSSVGSSQPWPSPVEVWPPLVAILSRLADDASPLVAGIWTAFEVGRTPTFTEFRNFKVRLRSLGPRATLTRNLAANRHRLACCRGRWGCPHHLHPRSLPAKA